MRAPGGALRVALRLRAAGRREASADAKDELAAHLAAMRACARRHRWDQALALLRRRHAACGAGVAASSAGAPSGSPTFVAMLASHVTSAARLERLKQCLASVAAQRGGPPLALLASISAGTPGLLDGVRQAVRMFEAGPAAASGLRVHALLHSGRRPQFVHLAALEPPLRRLAAGEALAPVLEAEAGSEAREGETADWVDDADVERLWLLFTDDDDLWHPSRTEVFRQAATAYPSPCHCTR